MKTSFARETQPRQQHKKHLSHHKYRQHKTSITIINKQVTNLKLKTATSTKRLFSLSLQIDLISPKFCHLNPLKGFQDDGATYSKSFFQAQLNVNSLVLAEKTTHLLKKGIKINFQRVNCTYAYTYSSVIHLLHRVTKVQRSRGCGY